MQHSRNPRYCKASQGEPLGRRPGRPLKSKKQLIASRKQHVMHALRKHHSKTQSEIELAHGKLSRLEKLPVELLQKIFFYSLETNLPRASLPLLQALSTEAIFNALIIFAYFDDDGFNPVEKRHFKPATYHRLECGEKIRLQQSICSCRWFTVQRVKSCLGALCRLSMVQAWHSEELQEEAHSHDNNTANIDTTQPTVANEMIRDFAPLPALDERIKLEQHYLARTRVEDLGSNQFSTQTNGDYLPRIVTWSSCVDEQGKVYKSTDLSISTLAARHIPDWLLCRSSWDEAELSLLRLLRQGYTFIQKDHVMSISAKALFEGMRNAITLANVDALMTLVEIHNAFFKFRSRSSQDADSVELTPLSHHPLPLELFHLAVKQQVKATELLSLLLRSGIDTLPLDDVPITAWALHESSQGNTLASWLLNHMEGIADYGLPRRGHLFVDGCLSWRARGSFPFPETAFAMELGYLAGTPVVPSGLHGQPCGFVGEE